MAQAGAAGGQLVGGVGGALLGHQTANALMGPASWEQEEVSAPIKTAVDKWKELMAKSKVVRQSGGRFGKTVRQSTISKKDLEKGKPSPI